MPKKGETMSINVLDATTGEPVKKMIGVTDAARFLLTTDQTVRAVSSINGITPCKKYRLTRGPVKVREAN